MPIMSGEHGDAELRRHLVGDARRRMAGDHVRHLVADHGGELVLVLGDLEQAGVDADLAAGQGEGVDLLGLEDLDLPVAADLARDRPGDALHIAVGALVARRWRLLLELLEGCCTHLRHLGVGDQPQLAPAGRRCGTGCNERDDQGGDGGGPQRRGLIHGRAPGAKRQPS
jgi:hypothetical protein